MHLELETLLDLYLLQDEFLRGGALRGGEGDEVGAGGEVLEHNVVEHKTGTLREKVARMMRYVASTMFEEACTSIPLRPSLPILVKNQS